MRTKGSLKKGSSEFYNLLTSYHERAHSLSYTQGTTIRLLKTKQRKLACVAGGEYTKNWSMQACVTPTKLNQYNFLKMHHARKLNTQLIKRHYFPPGWQSRKIQIFWKEVRVTCKKIISNRNCTSPELISTWFISRQTKLLQKKEANILTLVF